MTLDTTWLAHLNEAFLRHFGITTTDAGFSDSDLARYADLSPKDAVLELGADYDLERVDVGWR